MSRKVNTRTGRPDDLRRRVLLTRFPKRCFDASLPTVTRGADGTHHVGREADGDVLRGHRGPGAAAQLALQWGRQSRQGLEQRRVKRGQVTDFAIDIRESAKPCCTPPIELASRKLIAWITPRSVSHGRWLRRAAHAAVPPARAPP